MRPFIRTFAALAVAAALSTGSAHAVEVIKLSFELPVTHNFNKAAQTMADNVARRTNGEVKIELYPAGQLAKDSTFIKTINSGGIDAGLSPTLYWTGVMPIAGILDVPYVITTHAQAQRVLAGPVGARLLKELERFDLVGLGYFNYGFGIYGNNKRELKKPDDFKGLKMRTNHDIGAKLLQAFGASPVFLSGSEVFLALERGTVDGAHTGMSSIIERKMFGAMKYVTVDNHNAIPYFVVVRKAVFDRLSPANQKILAEAVREAAASVSRLQEQDDAEGVKVLRANGVAVVELTPAEVKTWQAAAAPVREFWLSKAGADGAELLKLMEKEAAQ
jgi:tripartite ATP-independent transporter DctP family solute receptor